MFLRKEKSLWERFTYTIRYRKNIAFYKSAISLCEDETFYLDQLKKNGYVVIENFIQSHILKQVQVIFQESLELLQFESPCLGQSLISESNHKDLIEGFFYATNKELLDRGLMFNRNEVVSLSDAIAKFEPIILTSFLLEKSRLCQSIWLDEKILRIVAGYMGLVPTLTEAYVRRSYPSRYKVMNHFWHRDLNHKHHLLKAFIAFTDCDINNGPHEYISGTHMNFSHLNTKRYYTDYEVDEIYPVNSPSRIIGTVKEGSLIIEDTRGLHRAQLPLVNHRDMGFAVFTTNSTPAYFKIKAEDYNNLTDLQKMFIPKINII